MNKAQIIGVGVALAAGAGAFMLMNGSGSTPQSPIAAAPVAQTTDQVLVATRDLTYGTSILDTDLSWLDWPKSALPKGVVLKSESPSAKEDIKSSYVRVPIANGEPIRRERLIKGPTAGLMSTLLPSGKRAIAIEVSASTTAGGFILPNDRVDVIRTFRDQEQTRDKGVEVVGSETILTNVRVLAMGETYETKNGESTLKGVTATLELEPRQAELIVLAQRTGSGQLILALRPLVDANPKDEANAAPPQDPSDGNMTVVRFGVPSSIRGK